jgi:uncharacterized delta-60 repeat protein
LDVTTSAFQSGTPLPCVSLRFFAPLLCAVISSTIVAAEGDIDATFGDGGSATISVIALGAYFPSPPIVQSDGKIVVCGAEIATAPYAETSYVYRFLANGGPDAGFGDGGRALVANAVFACENVRLQDDDKIVISGAIDVDGTTDVETNVLRFDSDGTLDTAFGVGGVADVNLLPGGYDSAERVAIAPDGSIVLGIPLDPSSFGIVRLRTDGSLDGTFGDGGRVTITFPDSTEPDLRSLLFDADERLTVVGSVESLDGAQSRVFAAARLLADGTLDASFGDDGLATFPLAGDASARDAVRNTDGSTLIAGIVQVGDDTQIALIRMMRDGALDTAFANGGSRVLSINGINDTVFDLLPRNDGSWMLSGFTQTPQNTREGFLLALDGNANPIPSFGIDGAKTYAASNGNNYFIGLAAQGDNFIVYGTSTDRGSPDDDTFFLTRIDGNLSTSVRGHSHHAVWRDF